MEWTKIKPKHFLLNDFTLAEKGTLATILCLTALLERVPNHQEMVKATHYKALIALQQRLKGHSMDLQYIVNKVLEDSLKVDRQRAVSRATSDKYRKKQKDGDASHDTTDKIREDKIREDKRESAKKKRFTPPSVLEVEKYCKERNNNIDPQAFIDFYETRGWKLKGGISMKSWQGAVRTWEKRERGSNGNERSRLGIFRDTETTTVDIKE